MKKTLEDTFDLPFHVSEGVNEYTIFPENDMEELFEVHIWYRSGVRLIIEAHPQKHAAAMLTDMANAPEEKRNRFLAYLKLFKEKNAKVAAEVNGRTDDFSEWPSDWRNMSVRISKIEEHDFSFLDMAKEWAVAACGMMLSLLNVEAIEREGVIEGKKIQVLQTKYERNPINRQICLEKHGCTCKICGFDFENVYGAIGKGFIHVHHIEMISQREGEYIPDPYNDLIPVCPNCHAMLHSSTPPLMPEELIAIIYERKNKS